ncbi:hypothetical protein TSUD_48250 [Trifolium subterraneum]|nr:hypothetical protein TSUD_48250 [Trifolium subterraneum]
MYIPYKFSKKINNHSKSIHDAQLKQLADYVRYTNITKSKYGCGGADSCNASCFFMLSSRQDIGDVCNQTHIFDSKS